MRPSPKCQNWHTYSGDIIWEISSLQCAVSKLHNGILHHYSPQNINFDNHPWMTVPLWASGSQVEKFQHIAGEKSTMIDTLGKEWFQPHRPSVAQYGSAPREPLTQWGLVNEHPLPQLCKVCQSAHCLPHPPRTLKWPAKLRTDHALGHKTSRNAFKKSEIISSIFSGHNAMKLEINNKRKARKLTNMWPMEWSQNLWSGRIYSQTTSLIGSQYLKYIRNYYHSIKKASNPILKWTKDINRQFSKKACK